MTIYEILQFYCQLVNKNLDEDQAYDILHYVNLQLDLHSVVDSLSGGEKQRLSIACGLLKNASLFLFDEPFAFLDNENKKIILSIIKKLAYQDYKMIIVSSHDKLIQEEFDSIYLIHHQKIELIKEKVNQLESNKPNSIPFHFSILKDYIRKNNKHNQFKNRILYCLLSFIITLSVVLGRFNEHFQIANGLSLLDMMNHEVLIINNQKQAITPHQQAIIKNKLSSYTCFADYELQIDNQTFIKGYLDNEVNSFQLYDDFMNKSSKSIYVSYSLYRKNNRSLNFQFGNLTISATHVLSPSVESQNKIYLPYQDYISFLKNFQINIDLVQVNSLKVPIKEINDINEIKNLLPNEFTLYEQQLIGLSLQTLHFFNQSYIQIISLITFIIVIAYKIFDFIKRQKDIAILKILGIEDKNIIFMKIYQEGLMFLLCIVLSIVMSSLLLFIFHIFTFNSFLNVFLWTLGYVIILFVILNVFYSFYIKKLSGASLLRFS